MWVAVHVLAQAAVIRVPLRPHRNPASRLSWVVVLVLLADAATTAAIRVRQQKFLARSRRVTAEEVAA